MTTGAEKFEARICKGMPTDCCDYGVISLETGKEVCRVWLEQDARKIAVLLNGAAPASAAERVKVKPLEWVEHGDRDLVWHRAMPPIGFRYNIEDDGFAEKKLTLTVGQLVVGNFDVLDEAKAAAQADYDRRVLSCLTHPFAAPHSNAR